MKAVWCTEYGLPRSLAVREVGRPAPKDNEVLVEVHASAVTTHNLCLVRGRPLFTRLIGHALTRPRVRTPGSDVAGRVAEVGRDVTQFAVGDDVFGDTSEYGFGAYAEYVCVPEKALAKKPANISFEEAAAVPQAGLVALQGLRDKGQIRRGQKVLIYGASGGIGSFAVQIARCFGAEVTGVCSTRNLDMVRSLGADHVVDYTEAGYADNGATYDLIFAVAYRKIRDHIRALRSGGVYVSVGSPSLWRILEDVLIGPRMVKGQGKKVVGGWAVTPNKDLGLLRELIETGHIKPIVDRSYPLHEAAEAMRHFSAGHSRGRVIITVGSWGSGPSAKER